MCIRRNKNGKSISAGAASSRQYPKMQDFTTRRGRRILRSSHAEGGSVLKARAGLVSVPCQPTGESVREGRTRPTQSNVSCRVGPKRGWETRKMFRSNRGSVPRRLAAPLGPYPPQAGDMIRSESSGEEDAQGRTRRSWTDGIPSPFARPTYAMTRRATAADKTRFLLSHLAAIPTRRQGPLRATVPKRWRRGIIAALIYQGRRVRADAVISCQGV